MKQNSELESRVAEEVERCTTEIIKEQIKQAWDDELDEKCRLELKTYCLLI